MMAATGLRPTRPRPIPAWPRAGWARVARSAIQRALLLPVTRLLCGPRVAPGREHLPDGPLLLVANHASHADTAVILRALPPRIRRRTAVAAAEDHFFTGRRRGPLVSLLTGAFPFPRAGSEGLDRADQLLRSGWSVLMYPQGTRAGGRFRCGVGVLARRGHRVVPVGVAGTEGILPKGRTAPRPGRAAVAFGAPMRWGNGSSPEAVASLLEANVRSLSAAARAALAEGRPSLYARAKSVGTSPAGLAVMFAWGVAEALFFPIVPDLGLALLALAAPAGFLALALAATAGSVAGGAMAYLAGATGWAPPMALVTDGMHAAAGGWMAADGAPAVWRQPWSGIPYKVFGFGAAEQGVSLGSFAGITALARGLRFVEVGAVFAGGGWVLRRWIPRRYGACCVALTMALAIGLNRVVGSWS